MDVGPAGVKQLQELVLRIINLSVPLAFVALTVMLFWAGIKFITSSGEAKPLQAAWQAVTWALLGILFLALAGLILRLVEAFTGVAVFSQFCIGFVGSDTGCK